MPSRSPAPARNGSWRGSGSHSCEQFAFEGAHRGLLGRFGVIPAADMQRPMRDEQAQLVGRRPPADVARVPATPGFRLFSCALDRDDDVAEMRQAAGWEREDRRRGTRAEGLGGSSGNDSTSVGPSLPRCIALSSASSRSSLRISPMLAGTGARPASSARPTTRASSVAGRICGTPPRRSTSTRQSPTRWRLIASRCRSRRLRRSRPAAIELHDLVLRVRDPRYRGAGRRTLRG